MKNVIQKIKNTKGFVSLEVIIIAGALIILGGVILFFFNENASDMTGNSGEQLGAAQEKIQGDNSAPTGVTLTQSTD